MRKRTILGLALVAAAVTYMRRKNAASRRDRSRELSPINEPIPGDGPIDEEDRPRDYDQ